MVDGSNESFYSADEKCNLLGRNFRLGRLFIKTSMWGVKNGKRKIWVEFLHVRTTFHFSSNNWFSNFFLGFVCLNITVGHRGILREKSFQIFQFNKIIEINHDEGILCFVSGVYS